MGVRVSLHSVIVSVLCIVGLSGYNNGHVAFHCVPATQLKCKNTFDGKTDTNCMQSMKRTNKRNKIIFIYFVRCVCSAIEYWQQMTIVHKVEWHHRNTTHTNEPSSTNGNVLWKERSIIACSRSQNWKFNDWPTIAPSSFTQAREWSVWRVINKLESNGI